MWKTFRWLISERSLGWWKTAPSRYRVKLIFWHLYVPVHYQPPCLFLTDAKAQWNGERKLGKFWAIEVLLFLFASLSIIYNMCYVKPAHFLILATFRYYLLPCYSNDPVKLKQNFVQQKSFLSIAVVHKPITSLGLLPCREISVLWIRVHIIFTCLCFLFRKEFEASKYLISQAEKDIANRLKPLLDRAEVCFRISYSNFQKGKSMRN